MAAFSAMSYSQDEENRRAFAEVGSALFSVGLLGFGAVAYLCREMLRTVRERRSENWQATSAQITSGDVKAIHGLFIDHAIGNLGYAYSVEDTYYSGYLTGQFWNEQRAWRFVDQGQNRQVMIKYKLNKPQTSVLRLLDVLCAKSADTFRPIIRKQQLRPWLTLLWSLRKLSDWARSSLQKQARNWPSTEGTVEYAEPMIAGEDEDTHWVGELHYTYSVDGCAYSDSHNFRAYDEEDAKEQVEPWRGRKLIIRYFPGNPARSVFIEREQLPVAVMPPADES